MMDELEKEAFVCGAQMRDDLLPLTSNPYVPKQDQAAWTKGWKERNSELLRQAGDNLSQ